jgi:hypothetical protein
LGFDHTCVSLGTVDPPLDEAFVRYGQHRHPRNNDVCDFRRWRHFQAHLGR